ncbi:hypothetical protein [Chondromyces apiculatus]|uniref:hypothetical protein n=1 Tax=Chondromyces apiculatus TaxID=51 RepID=UPI0012DF719F|nr:hypothetical protein [Chondromyces apiculatus]
MKTARLSADVVIALARLIWPDFVEIDGRVFLVAQYSDLKLKELRAQGFDETEAQYWMNLFPVEGLLGDEESLQPDHEDEFAAILEHSWAAKLAADYPGRRFMVKTARDGDVGDVCVVFTNEPV